jgi:putative lipase involved disintegration of autophagic bodies
MSINDKYELDIVDQQGKTKSISEKDELYLETLDIFSKIKKSYLL